MGTTYLSAIHRRFYYHNTCIYMPLCFRSIWSRGRIQVPGTPLLFVRGDEWGGLQTLTCSHRGDGLSCRHGVKALLTPTLTHSLPDSNHVFRSHLSSSLPVYRQTINLPSVWIKLHQITVLADELMCTKFDLIGHHATRLMPCD